MPPLALDQQIPHRSPARIWVDTDAACGFGERTDADDCLALLLLARTGLEVAGVSTVHGNAPLADTDRITRELVEKLEADGAVWPAVHRGRSMPGPASEPTAAATALQIALTKEPLLILALGPLTNVAAALAERPALWPRVVGIVAVMGRRPGHIFHPAEGAGTGTWLGHGPIFRDFNFASDPGAAVTVLHTGIPVVMVPYVAARSVEFTGEDLDALAAGGGASSWVADRARAWLAYWHHDIGRAGFYPFDAIAAAYVRDPAQLACARVTAWVGDDPRLFVPFWNPPALMVTQTRDDLRHPQVAVEARYCPTPRDGFERAFRQWLLPQGHSHHSRESRAVGPSRPAPSVAASASVWAGPAMRDPPSSSATR